MKAKGILTILIALFFILKRGNKKRIEYGRDMECLVYSAFSLSDKESELITKMQDKSYIDVARASMGSLKIASRSLGNCAPLHVDMIFALSKELAKEILMKKGVEVTEERDFMISVFIRSYLNNLDYNKYKVERRRKTDFSEGGKCN